jgi:ADP-ribose pyrophosphatase YjhB (NUDIX family)
LAIWKPKTFISVKVLGLVWRGHELLAGGVEDSSGQVIGVRPLGGGIEFGETRAEALEREFREELGCSTTVIEPWHTIENIFEHEGNVGHQYVFLANVELGNSRLYAMDRIDFCENDGGRCSASWYSPTQLPTGVHLYPVGLLDLVQTGSRETRSL